MTTRFRVCPKCKAEHPATATYCGCGYRWPQEAQQSNIQADPYRHHCAYTTGGQRCHYLGTFGHSTMGGGDLYCRGHADCGNTTLGAEIVERSHQEHPAPGWWSPELQRAAGDQAQEARREQWLEARGMESLPFETPANYKTRLREYGVATLRKIEERQRSNMCPQRA